MANRLFDTPDLVAVLMDGPDDGSMWTAGFDLQAGRAATELMVQDPCTEAAVRVAGPADPSSPKVYTVTSFSATVSARRNVRCDNGDALEIVSSIMQQGGIVSAAEYGLWFGAPNFDANAAPSLQNVDVTTTVRQSAIQDTCATVINAYSGLTTVQEYILHLGVQAALDLSAQGYTETIDQAGQLRVKATGAPIVVSPYYPTLGVAVTGPIEVRVGFPAAYQAWDIHINRTNIVGYTMMAIAFDPSSSVRSQ